RGMTDRHWDLVEALALRVRLFSDEQAMRFLGLRDLSGYRHFLQPLEAAGYVERRTFWAKPVPEMREPLLSFDESSMRLLTLFVDDLPNLFDRVLDSAHVRWANVSAVPTRCVIATNRGGHLFGCRHRGQLGKPLQASHDLAVSQVFVATRHEQADL